MQANRNIHLYFYWLEFASYPAAKHPKHIKFAIRDIQEKPVNFFYCSTRASTLVSAIILLTRFPLQKFPSLFIIIIPYYNLSFQYFAIFTVQHFSTTVIMLMLLNKAVLQSKVSNCIYHESNTTIIIIMVVVLLS